MCREVTHTHRHLLDTLETSGHFVLTDERQKLVRRTFQKSQTLENTFKLIDLNSPLIKEYWDTYHCGEILLQEGDKFSSQRCHKKWCQRCNHIRTANLIEGYKHLLDEFESPTLLVLTMRNCKGRELKGYYSKMVTNLKRATRNIRKTHGINPKGIRTWECTYNSKEDTYHPHWNVICNSWEEAELIRSYWMNSWGDKTDIKAQSIQTIEGERGLLEVFKYVTKLSVKETEETIAQDWIFQCTKGKRIVQAFGGLKKEKEVREPQEDIERVEGEENIEIWKFEKEEQNYISGAGVLLVSDIEKDTYLREVIAKKKARKQHNSTHKKRGKPPQKIKSF